MLSRRDCPILWMIPCYLYELLPSRYFLFNSICFLCVSVTCLDSVCLLLVLALSWGVCARGSLGFPVLLFLVRVVTCSSEIWWLPSAWLLFFPIFSEADRDWMKSVHSTRVFVSTHMSSSFQDFLFLSTKALYRFSFLNFLPPEHFPLSTAVFIPPSSCTAGML